jgi:hypothetical protein
MTEAFSNQDVELVQGEGGVVRMLQGKRAAEFRMERRHVREAREIEQAAKAVAEWEARQESMPRPADSIDVRPLLPEVQYRAMWPPAGSGVAPLCRVVLGFLPAAGVPDDVLSAVGLTRDDLVEVTGFGPSLILGEAKVSHYAGHCGVGLEHYRLPPFVSAGESRKLTVAFRDRDRQQALTKAGTLPLVERLERLERQIGGKP